MGNKNILSKIINGIKNGWERLGEPDIPDGTDINATVIKEVEEIKKVQEKVHEQGGFVPKARVNEERAQVNAKKRGNSSKKGKQKILGET